MFTAKAYLLAIIIILANKLKEMIKDNIFLTLPGSNLHPCTLTLSLVNNTNPAEAIEHNR